MSHNSPNDNRRNTHHHHHKNKHRGHNHEEPLDPTLGVPPRVIAAIRNPELAAYPPDKELIVGGLNLSERVREFKVEQDEDGGIKADILLAGRLDYRLVNAPARLRLFIDNWPFTMITGNASRPVLGAASTQLLVTSPAGRLESCKLGKRFAWRGGPGNILRIAIKDSKRYDMGQVRISGLGNTIRLFNEDALEEEESIRSVMDKIKDITGCVYRDIPEAKGMDAFLPPGPVLGSPKWHYEAQEIIDWVPEGDAEQLFTEVVVLRRENNDAEPPIAPFRFSENVNYQNMPYPPDPNSIEYFVTSDDDPLNNKSYAKSFVKNRARKHARQHLNNKMTVPLNPLLRMYDVLSVGEDVFDQEEAGRRRFGKRRLDWLGVIENSIAHTWTPGSLTTEINGTSEVTDDTFTADRPARRRRRHTQVVNVSGATTDWAGVDADGFWIDTDSSPPYAGEDEAGLWIDDALVSPKVGIDSGGFWIDDGS